MATTTRKKSKHRRRAARKTTKRATKRTAKTAARRPAREAGAAPEHDGDAPRVRPTWSGTISFGLVSVPVNLYPAVRATGATLRVLGPDGTPLQRRYVSTDGATEVPWNELVRGYETESGDHVVLTDEELESVAPRKSRDIDLRRFVPADSLDPMLFVRPYVLTPAGDSTKPYRLLAAAMEREKRIGIATFVMRTKEYLVAILARDGILWAETLRFAGEVRSPADVGLRAARKAPARAVAAFERILRDHEQEAIDREDLAESRQAQLLALAERKAKHDEDVVEPPPVESDADVAMESEDAPDLFATIERSLRLVTGGETASPKRRPRRAASGARRRSPARRRRVARAGAAWSRR